MYNKMRKIALAFYRKVRRFVAMVIDSQSKKSFEEVISEGIAKLEDLQQRQQKTMELLRDAVAKKKGIDEIRKQIQDT